MTGTRVVSVAADPEGKCYLPGVPRITYMPSPFQILQFQDLQGYWRGPGSGTENMEEHPKTNEDDRGTSLIVEPRDGKVPYRA